MDLFGKLRSTALQQNMSGEFPSWLLTEVMAIADDPERYADKAHVVAELITQISNYDPYAGAGCFDTSVGAETIRSTIRQLVA
ncbi:MAG: hypothetical protein CXR31_04055 [Geobacter sp.]|nr:MAG: hypothetical protein CXR31_04055 [Geobacter sp.]